MTAEMVAAKSEIVHPQVFLERLQPSPFLKGGEYPWAKSILNPNLLPTIEDDGTYIMFVRCVNGYPSNFNDGPYTSRIAYIRLKENEIYHPGSLRLPEKPVIVPSEIYENDLGCEDPLCIRLDLDCQDKAALKDEEGINPQLGYLYLLYYVAVGGKVGADHDIRVALAASQDLQTWKKYGVVGPMGEATKSGLVLPKRDSEGRYVMLYTVWTESPESSIMIARFDSLKDLLHPPEGMMDENLRNYQKNLFLGPSSFKVHKGPEIGAGAVQLNDDSSILVICPENRRETDAWDIAALLLDRDANILASVDLPIIGGLLPEDKGIICRDCTFPRGAAILNIGGKRMFIISAGTGDNGAVMFSVGLNDLMAGFQADILKNNHT